MTGARSQYQFLMTLCREDGTQIGELPVAPDWSPAYEWTLLEGMRTGALSPSQPPGPARVEPVWHPAAHEPYVGGFRVVVSPNGAGGAEVDCVFPNAYFKALARRASSLFVERGELKAGDHYTYAMSAYWHEGGEPERRAAFEVEEAPQPVQIQDSSLAEFVSDSVLQGNDPPRTVPPVFIPQHILDETADLARRACLAAPGSETGGVLVGHLHRSGQEVFVEATAQVHARNAVASHQYRLTFTPDTWSDVQGAIDLRGRGESWVGWWHSHPKEIAASVSEDVAAFMSPEDCALHRTCFPRAYSVALVVTEQADGGHRHSLFGWFYGLIAARGFYVLGAPAGVQH